MKSRHTFNQFLFLFAVKVCILIVWYKTTYRYLFLKSYAVTYWSKIRTLKGLIVCNSLQRKRLACCYFRRNKEATVFIHSWIFVSDSSRVTFYYSHFKNLIICRRKHMKRTIKICSYNSVLSVTFIRQICM